MRKKGNRILCIAICVIMVSTVLPIPLVQAPPPDQDGDGLTETQELTFGTDPDNPDTDNDGLYDGWEDINGDMIFDWGEGWGEIGDPAQDGLGGYGTDPLNPDSDLDGLKDGVEVGSGEYSEIIITTFSEETDYEVVNVPPQWKGVVYVDIPVGAKCMTKVTRATLDIAMNDLMVPHNIRAYSIGDIADVDDDGLSDDIADRKDGLTVYHPEYFSHSHLDLDDDYSCWEVGGIGDTDDDMIRDDVAYSRSNCSPVLENLTIFHTNDNTVTDTFLPTDDVGFAGAFDDDGKFNDIAYISNSGYLSIYHADVSSTTTTAFEGKRVGGVDDIDGDMRCDDVAYIDNSDKLCIYYNDITPVSFCTDVDAVDVGGVGNFDDSGECDDIVFGDSGNLYIYHTNDGTITDLGLEVDDYRVGGVGDINGDGIEKDIAFAKSEYMNLYFYDISDTTTTRLDVGNNGDMEWEFTGDLNTPQTVTDFSDELNEYIKDAVDDDGDGYIRVPSAVHTEILAAINFSNLDIRVNVMTPESPTIIDSLSDGSTTCTLTSDPSGETVYVDIPINESRLEYIENATLTLEGVAGPEDWDERIPRDTEDYPYELDIGDANNDGYNDIVTTAWWGGVKGISILLWNPVIKDWDPPINKTVDGDPYDVVVADADNDGYNDIVVASTYSAGVDLFRWNASLLDWELQTIPTLFYPSRLDVGDADNDGDNDIAVITFSGSFPNTNAIEILLWIGDTWFDYILNQTIHPGLMDIAVGDVNNDNYNDIALTYQRGSPFNVIRIYTWNSGGMTWDFPIEIPISGSWPYPIEVADVNNDGMNDIAFGYEGGSYFASVWYHGVGVLLWNGVGWASEIFLPVYSEPQYPVGGKPGFDVGDADNDGDNDIIYSHANFNKVFIFRWEVVDWEPFIEKPTGSAPLSAGIGDVDDDGDNDIVVGDYYDSTVSIFLWEPQYPLNPSLDVGDDGVCEWEYTNIPIQELDRIEHDIIVEEGEGINDRWFDFAGEDDPSSDPGVGKLCFTFTPKESFIMRSVTLHLRNLEPAPSPNWLSFNFDIGVIEGDVSAEPMNGYTRIGTTLPVPSIIGPTWHTFYMERGYHVENGKTYKIKIQDAYPKSNNDENLDRLQIGIDENPLGPGVELGKAPSIVIPGWAAAKIGGGYAKFSGPERTPDFSYAINKYLGEDHTECQHDIIADEGDGEGGLWYNFAGDTSSNTPLPGKLYFTFTPAKSFLLKSITLHLRDGHSTEPSPDWLKFNFSIGEIGINDDVTAEPVNGYETLATDLEVPVLMPYEPVWETFYMHDSYLVETGKKYKVLVEDADPKTDYDDTLDLIQIEIDDSATTKEMMVEIALYFYAGARLNGYPVDGNGVPYVSVPLTLRSDKTADIIISDIEIVLTPIITDPLDSDSDDDWLWDGWMDVNNNGVFDYIEEPGDWEFPGETQLFTNPIDPNTDGDGIKDGNEHYTYNTDPLDFDVNNDGVPDGDLVTSSALVWITDQNSETILQSLPMTRTNVIDGNALQSALLVYDYVGYSQEISEDLIKFIMQFGIEVVQIRVIESQEGNIPPEFLNNISELTGIEPDGPYLIEDCLQDYWENKSHWSETIVIADDERFIPYASTYAHRIYGAFVTDIDEVAILISNTDADRIVYYGESSSVYDELSNIETTEWISTLEEAMSSLTQPSRIYRDQLATHNDIAMIHEDDNSGLDDNIEHWKIAPIYTAMRQTMLVSVSNETEWSPTWSKYQDQTEFDNETRAVEEVDESFDEKLDYYILPHNEYKLPEHLTIIGHWSVIPYHFKHRDYRYLISSDFKYADRNENVFTPSHYHQQLYLPDMAVGRITANNVSISALIENRGFFFDSNEMIRARNVVMVNTILNPLKSQQILDDIVRGYEILYGEDNVYARFDPTGKWDGGIEPPRNEVLNEARLSEIVSLNDHGSYYSISATDPSLNSANIKENRYYPPSLWVFFGCSNGLYYTPNPSSSLNDAIPRSGAVNYISAVWEAAFNDERYFTQRLLLGEDLGTAFAEGYSEKILDIISTPGVYLFAAQQRYIIGDPMTHYGADENDPDTDSDLLGDWTELLKTRTNPLKSDTDGDILPDGWEVFLYDSDPLISTISPGDTDDDNISDIEEFNIYKTDPILVDTDSDGLNDGEELLYGSDPLNPDTDGDGLPDGWEVKNDPDGEPLNNSGLNPTESDTDGDSIEDGDEDFDNDGLTNLDEYLARFYGWKHDDNDWGLGLNPQDPDTDEDGLNDGDEPNWNEDTDIDGYINALDPDSDNDGWSDGEEVAAGTDPLDPNSHP